MGPPRLPQTGQFCQNLLRLTRGFTGISQENYGSNSATQVGPVNLAVGLPNQRLPFQVSTRHWWMDCPCTRRQANDATRGFSGPAASYLPNSKPRRRFVTTIHCVRPAGLAGRQRRCAIAVRGALELQLVVERSFVAPQGRPVRTAAGGGLGAFGSAHLLREPCRSISFTLDTGTPAASAACR